MQVNYCDLCGQPIKDGESWVLYLSPPTILNQAQYYDELIKTIKKNSKEICLRCKDIFDKIFELRLQRLSELTEEINNAYHMPLKKIKEKNGEKHNR